MIIELRCHFCNRFLDAIQEPFKKGVISRTCKEHEHGVEVESAFNNGAICYVVLTTIINEVVYQAFIPMKDFHSPEFIKLGEVEIGYFRDAYYTIGIFKNLNLTPLNFPETMERILDMKAFL